MASYAYRIPENFRYILSEILPDANGRRFREIDPFDLISGDQSGSMRNFWVDWTGSDEDGEPTDLYDRVASHEYVVHIIYPKANASHQKVMRTIARDRHQINKALRNPDGFLGYNAANPSTDIGLWERKRTSDELSMDEDIWELTTVWQCTVREVE